MHLDRCNYVDAFVLSFFALNSPRLQSRSTESPPQPQVDTRNNSAPGPAVMLLEGVAILSLYEYDGADLELEQIYFRSQEPSIIIVGSLYLIPRALTLGGWPRHHLDCWESSSPPRSAFRFRTSSSRLPRSSDSTIQPVLSIHLPTIVSPIIDSPRDRSIDRELISLDSQVYTGVLPGPADERGLTNH